VAPTLLLPSCRRRRLQHRASPRPFQPAPTGAHVDCCVFKGRDRVDPSKWAVWSHMAIWFHPNLRAKFPSFILTGKREPPFPQKNIAPHHPPNCTLLLMRSIFMTGEVGVIRPNHRIWAIILTPPFEAIDLKKMGRHSLSLGLGLRYDIFVVQRYVWYLIFM
jgi:hypothetical protein